MGGGRRSCGIELGLAGFSVGGEGLRRDASDLVGGRRHKFTTTNVIL